GRRPPPARARAPQPRRPRRLHLQDDAAGHARRPAAHRPGRRAGAARGGRGRAAVRPRRLRRAAVQQPRLRPSRRPPDADAARGVPRVPHLRRRPRARDAAGAGGVAPRAPPRRGRAGGRRRLPRHGALRRAAARPARALPRPRRRRRHARGAAGPPLGPQPRRRPLLPPRRRRAEWPPLRRRPRRRRPAAGSRAAGGPRTTDYGPRTMTTPTLTAPAAPPAGAPLDTRRFARSVAHQREAHRLIPGGCHTYARGDDQLPEWAPVVVARGAGCRVWDLDGNAYVEYGMGLRAVTLGHAEPRVVAAAARALQGGACFSRPSAIEREAAEAFLGLVPGADMVKFCKDG